MAWFGDGLSSLSNLKGQITSFTKEVLSEGIVEEIDERSKELEEANERCVRLEELLNSKDAEISLLRRENCELQKALVETSNSKSKDEKNVGRYEDGDEEFFWDPLSSKHRNSKNGDNAHHHLREQLTQAVHRIRELEGELQRTQQLDNSTTKSDLPDDGHRNVEFLRAKQDMVNRIIQLEEKGTSSSHEETALINEFRMAIDKLESPEKLDLLRAALAALHHENGTSANETALGDKLRDLEEENARLLASVEQLDEEHQQAIDEVLLLKDQVEKKHKCLQNAYEKLYVEWNEAREKASTRENAKNSMGTQTEEEKEEKEHESVLEELAQKTRDILRNCSLESEPGESIFETVARRYVETKWKKDLLERKVTELTRDLREMSEAKDNLQIECEDVQTQLDSVLLEIERSKVNLPSIPETALEKETESLEEEVTRLQVENERLSHLLAASAEAAAATTTTTGGGSELEEAAARLADCERELLEKKRELEAADARVAQLTAEIQKLRRENVSLAEQLTATEDESSDKLELLATEKALLEQENAELSTKHQRLLDEESRRIQVAGELEQELERLRGERESGSQELQALRELCETLETTKERLGAENERLRCALLDAESQREKALAEREELLTLVRTKHEESVQYHAEIQRLSDGPIKELEAGLAEEQSKNRQLRQRLAEAESKGANATREIERLRAHLLEIESSYTEEALVAERARKELEAKLIQAEERAKNSSTVYTSASIRANQQVETLQQQLGHVLQQRDDIQNKLSLAEDQILSQTASLTNLQIVLEQFQRDKERDIVIATERIHNQLKESEEARGKLSKEVSNLKEQLSEAKECLQAASRLGEELDRKAERIEQLNQEVRRLTELVDTAEQRMDEVRQSGLGKVDKNLMKNLLLGYLSSSASDKSSVLRVFATVLEFNESERDKAGLNGSNAQNSWFSRLAGATSVPTKDQETSLSAAFVKFLESESKPKAQLPALPISSSGLPKASHSRQSSISSSQSTLLLSNVTLPTFPDFVPTRNSGSILKEVLKDS